VITRNQKTNPRGFTLIEMLTSVAALVIVLGLMIGLSRYVRKRSAQTLTKNLLRQLDGVVTEYARRHEQALPEVTPFPPEPFVAAVTAKAPGGRLPADPPATADRAMVRQAAADNNRDLLEVLKKEKDLAERLLSELPKSVYDKSQLRDAWGSPIVFMPTKHPWVGTAPRDRAYFLFSAGPDRDYLTPVDNLYSYEEISGGR
jgi:prepilin-type N-terminal cleavage/methylation domain-containing protein